MNGQGAEALASSLHDPSKHAEVYRFVESMKLDKLGWKKAIESIAGSSVSSAEEYFVLLQVVEDYLVTRYNNGDESASTIVRQLLSHALQRVTTEDLPPFLVNKLAQIFALVFAADFPVRWPHFMQEVFLGGNLDDSRFASFYLKTLVAIDSEVVDREIQRAPEMLDRNTKIKDSMRDLCVKECVQSWLHILRTSGDGSVQAACLRVVGLYVDWVDIELIANDEIVPVIVQRLSHSQTTKAAQQAMASLIGKKMPSTKKLPLVVALTNVLLSNNLLSISQASDEEEEERIGALLSAIGLAIIEATTKRTDDEVKEEEAQGALALLHQQLPTILTLLDSTNQQASFLVLELTKSYSSILLQRNNQDSDGIIANIVAIAMKRCEFPEDLDMDGTGEDEADFMEYRMEMKQLLHLIALKRPEAVVRPLEEAFSDASTSALSPSRKEAIAHLVYSLSELMPSGLLNAKSGWLERATHLPKRLISSLSPESPSSAMTLLFFETASRYERLLAKEPHSILSLIPHYIGPFGINHPKAAVRSRVVYLFSRFVKNQRSVLSGVVPEVIVRVAPLLASSPPLAADDQGFLLEATTTLIVHGQLEVQSKAQYTGELVSTIAANFSKHLSAFDQAESVGDDKQKESLLGELSSDVVFAIKMTKAFGLTGKPHTMADCGCIPLFIQLLDLFTDALTPSRMAIAEPTRQLAGRVALCMEGEALPSLRALLARLAALASDVDSMQQLLILTQQIVHKHKGGISSSGIDIGAILDGGCALATASLPPTASDAIRRGSTYVRRALLSLVSTVISSSLLHLLPAETLERTVECACKLALDTDATTQKAAVSVLGAVAVFSPEVASRVVRVAASVPLAPHFNLSDAGSALVLHEISLCLQSTLRAHPTAVNAVLSSTFPIDFAQQLSSALETVNGKDLDRALTMLYTQLRE